LPSTSLVTDLKTNSTLIIPDTKSLTSNKTGILRTTKRVRAIITAVEKRHILHTLNVYL